MEAELQEYVEELFREIPNTRAALKVKEEFKTHMLQQYKEFILVGVVPEEAYALVIENLGDSQQLLAEIMPSRMAMKRADYAGKLDSTKAGHFLLHGPTYWTILIILYLIISVGTGKWAYTWIILVMGAVFHMFSIGKR